MDGNNRTHITHSFTHYRQFIDVNQQIVHAFGVGKPEYLEVTTKAWGEHAISTHAVQR